MVDWKSELGKGVLILDRIRQLDRAGLWTYFEPEPGASESSLDDVERRLGFQLDSQYREFLRHANGWRSFYQAVDLFGSPQLLGAAPMDTARALLSAVAEEDFQREVGEPISNFLPIAASVLQMDIFLLSCNSAEVIWFAGSLIDRFPCFDEFFLSMLDYNRREIGFLEKAK